MSQRINTIILTTLLSLTGSNAIFAQERAGLLLTEAGVSEIRANLGSTPVFDATLKQVQEEVDAAISQGIDVPVPKDFSGGYTHQQHKANFFVLQKAGALYQILDDEKYAHYVRDMLFEYEAMYKDLPLHPQERSYARGKLFWQCLNDSVWLVYVSQAYDAIYDSLSAAEREALENNLFRPMADFLSLENPQFFNRVHNHSTWGSAAVGMIGLAMNDEELVQRALHGLEDDQLELGLKDDDGGYIKVEGQRAGFLANLEEPFSPDGYYTEGPYYQRYAMYPFLVFAQALDTTRPELKVLEHKDGVLLNAVSTLLNLTDADGEFFPLNDAQKGMSYEAQELVTAVDIAYHLGGEDPHLLSIAQLQGQVLLDDAGFSVARAIADGKAQEFPKQSINLQDGPDGTQGGLAILRSGHQELVFKYTAQGLSHGHYDKLSFSYYAQGDEVLQDYGLVRFVNIEQKGGGNYLPENSTWAKQTIAHNTLTINETPHFTGSYDIGSQHHSELRFFDVSDPELQAVSARETNAYPGTTLERTMMLVSSPEFEAPFLLDVFNVQAEAPGQYDLPFYFLGQLIDTDFDYETPQALQPLGLENGYQHLYVEGTAQAGGEHASFSWLNEGRYHSLTTVTEVGDELLFTRIGAQDPEFNLRREPAFMIRRGDASQTVFASVIETHGGYDPVREMSSNSRSNVESLSITADGEYHVVTINTVSGAVIHIALASDPAENASHKLKIGTKTHRWAGPVYRTESPASD